MFPHSFTILRDKEFAVESEDIDTQVGAPAAHEFDIVRKNISNKVIDIKDDVHTDFDRIYDAATPIVNKLVA